MSFANQALAVLHVARHGAGLEPDVYNVPAEIDQEIASLKLAAMGVSIDELTPAQSDYLHGWSLGT